MTGSAALAALAEDPDILVEPPAGSRRIHTDRYCVVIGPHRRWAGVSGLRMASPEDATRAHTEISRLVGDIEQVVWNVGSSATPAALADDLRTLGLRDPDPPMDPTCVAMVLTEEPAPFGGLDVRRIESLEEHRAGLEILLAADTWTDRAAADERARAEEVYAERTRRGGYQWLAWHDGLPVAYACAEATTSGLFLSGGATLPTARGRGCYRALVRARWDEATQLGLPGLAVQAQHDTSAPILRNLGFVDVATVHTLQS